MKNIALNFVTDRFINNRNGNWQGFMLKGVGWRNTSIEKKIKEEKIK